MGPDWCGQRRNLCRKGRLSADYKRRLWLVIAINATMFLVEMGAGALAGSQALQADALDFLGDATTYGIVLVWHQSCGHRHIYSNPRTRRNFKGAEPDRNGSLGSWRYRISRSHPWHTAR